MFTNKNPLKQTEGIIALGKPYLKILEPLNRSIMTEKNLESINSNLIQLITIKKLSSYKLNRVKTLARFLSKQLSSIPLISKTITVVS